MANNSYKRGDGHERGFAAMSAERQREIARKGGETVSQNRQHMSEIGRKGGEASHGPRSSQTTTSKSNNIQEMHGNKNQTKHR